MAVQEHNPTVFHETYSQSLELSVNPLSKYYDESHDKAESFAWAGRPWVKAFGGQQQDPEPLLLQESGYTVLSYNVFADCKCSNVRYTMSKKWEKRASTLIREIASYNADILCLQDVDHFKDFWRAQLMLIGYDSVYKKRTQKLDAHYEGVLVAYKRDKLQLFKSVALDLNKAKKFCNSSEMGSAFKERLLTDDVALICLLQPWGERVNKPPKTQEELEWSGDESDESEEEERNKGQHAVLVCSAQLSSRQSDTNVRYYQAQYVCKQIEMANKEFQLPVLCGVSLFDSPISPAYHVFRTGRSPIKPQSPRKMPKPWGVAYCRGSTCVKFRPPYTTKEDPEILKYRIAWRPGGSLVLGFRQMVEVDPVRCLAYGEKVDENGIRRTYQLEDLQFNIVGLTSEIPFEFIVCAVNEIGEGIWSDPSMPVVMPNPERAPPMPALGVLKNTAEVTELREQGTMDQEDWDVEVAISSDPMSTATQSTPRLYDGRKNPTVPQGRILPVSVNPREGWKKALGGGYTEEVHEEINNPKNMLNTIVRDRETGEFLPSLTDSPRSKRALITGTSTRQFLGDSGLGDGVIPGPLTLALTNGSVEDARNLTMTGHTQSSAFYQQNSIDDDGSTIATAANTIESSTSSVNFMGGISQRKHDLQLNTLIHLKKSQPLRLQFGGDMESSLGNEPSYFDNFDEENSDEDEQEKEHRLGVVERKEDGTPKKEKHLFAPGDTTGGTYVQTQTGVTNTNTNANAQVSNSNSSANATTLPDIHVAPGGRRLNKATDLYDPKLALGITELHHEEEDRVKKHHAAQDDASSAFSLSACSTNHEDGSLGTGSYTRAVRERADADAWDRQLQEDAVNTMKEQQEKNLSILRDVSRVTAKLNDATFVDGSDLFQHIGVPHPRSIHYLNLRSGYEQYCSGGEPLFTESYPAEHGSSGVCTTDYIFYSGQALTCKEVLAIPDLVTLTGENPREYLAAADPLFSAPPSKCELSFGRGKSFEPVGGYGSSHKAASKSSIQHAKKILLEKLKDSSRAAEDAVINDENHQKNGGAYWGGVWAPFVTRNDHRRMHWLPNDTYASSHMALCIKIGAIDGHLCSEWS